MLTFEMLHDEAACFAFVRQLRWPQGAVCPRCGSLSITKNGHVPRKPPHQQYYCHACARYFDDLTGTVFHGTRRPLRVWLQCLYLMSLSVSQRQIAQDLGVSLRGVQRMCTALQDMLAIHLAPRTLTGTIECDEVYVVAGHKGQPQARAAAERPARRRKRRGRRGRGTLATDLAPILGMRQREGGISAGIAPDPPAAAHGGRVPTDAGAGKHGLHR